MHENHGAEICTKIHINEGYLECNITNGYPILKLSEKCMGYTNPT